MAYTRGEPIIHVTETEPICQSPDTVEAVASPDEVRVPVWLFAGFIGLVSGMIIGPSIMATTEAGSAKLAELSRRYVAGK